MQNQKPSSKELFNRLRDAKEAFDAASPRVFILENDSSIHIEDDLEELDLDDIEDYWDLVYDCILLAMKSPVKSYAHKSRLKSTYSSLKGQYLWPFKVYHPNRNQTIYFKFCIQQDADGTNYIHIDCHEDRTHTK
jgi:hypothetical protein